MRLLRSILMALGCLVLLPAPALAAGDVARGAVVYKKNCEQCHGVDGAADGPAAETMLPRPRIFKDNSSYKFRTTPSGELPLDQDLFNIISRGLPGTSMPDFDSLGEQDRWDLVAFIKSLSEDFADPDYIGSAKVMPELVDAEVPPSTPELLEKGKALFDENKCWQCHGQRGLGNGESWPDLEDEWDNAILPVNLSNRETYRGGASPFDIYRTISTGLNGTPMPAYSDSIGPGDRWALVHYIISLGPPDREGKDDTVVAARVAELPKSGDDESWSLVRDARFFTHPNIVEAPRLFWSSVEFITAQAVYNDHGVALRIQWDDRSNSTSGSAGSIYSDPDGAIHQGTDHPDRFSVMFPAKNDPKARPYIMMGDSKRAVNLWEWQADRGESLKEMNAKGWSNVSTQDEDSQGLSGSVSYKDGRYTLFATRALTTADGKNDVQLVPGEFVPVAFNVWDGGRGEVGQRRSMTTWYWLFLEPETPLRAYIVPPIGFLVALVLLGFMVGRTQRMQLAEDALGEDPTDTAEAPTDIDLAAIDVAGAPTVVDADNPAELHPGDGDPNAGDVDLQETVVPPPEDDG